MATDKKFSKVTFELMETLLEVHNLEEALTGTLEIIVRELDSEAAAIWLLDRKTNRLAPIFHTGPVDISNISIENGIGIEGLVTKQVNPCWYPMQPPTPDSTELYLTTTASSPRR